MPSVLMIGRPYALRAYRAWHVHIVLNNKTIERDIKISKLKRNSYYRASV